MQNETSVPVNTVNANTGVTNIIEKSEIRNTMIKTFLELADILKAHCGPYSGTAILSNPQNPMAEPVFTKDGINIVDSIRYASVMQDFVRVQLAYMGKRVERSAGDGTTSTMMIMAYALASMLSYLDSTHYVYSMVELTKVWNKLVSLVEEKYQPFVKYTQSITDPELIGYIAASQTYTSSHGDLELTHCIRELFKNTPREVWDTLVARKATYESEEKYKVAVHTSQYTLDNVTLLPANRRNKELGTVLEMKNASCMTRPYLTIGDDTQKFIIDYIDEAIVTGQQLIVITCNDMDSATVNHFTELFTEHPDHNVIFVLVPYEDAAINDVCALDVIHAQKNGGTLDMSQLNVFQADIECEGTVFRFTSGLFEDTGTGINPYYKDERYPSYNEYVDQIKQIIEKEKSDIARKNVKAIEKFTRILHKLLATKDVVFTVGGAAYDNAAGQDIALDALLATKCSLTKGFVAGRCVTLKQMLHDLRQETPKYVEGKDLSLLNAYIEALLKGIEEVDKALEDSISSQNIEKALQFKYSPVDYTRLDDPSYEVPESLDYALEKQTDLCIIQPVMTDITFLKRFGEVGLKFLTANRVITYGYYYVQQQKG